MLKFNKIAKNKEQFVKTVRQDTENYKIFFFSAPYDKPNTGDGDFVNAMIAANKKIGLESTWIQGTNTLSSGGSLYSSSIEISQDQLPDSFQDPAVGNVDLLKKLSEIGSIDFQDPIKFEQMIDVVKSDKTRVQAILKIIKYIKENTKNNQKPILALQFRPPETGCFLTPEDIMIIKSAGITVNITVHEYGLNYTRPHLQAYSHQFFEQADHVFFLNIQDQDAAVESSKLGKLYDAEGAVEKFSKERLPAKEELTVKIYDLASKSSVTQVPPTVKVSTDSIEESLQRMPNISWFGMIRPWKGIEQAIEIATLMQAKQIKGTPEEKEVLKGTKVIIAGLPAVNKTMLYLLSAAFNLAPSEIDQLKHDMEQTQKSSTSPPPCAFWTDWWKSKVKELRMQNREDLPPVEIHLDVDMDQNIQLHKECLYAYKPDSKGLAGNSSSIISEMAQKCITITKWGYCTPPEFLSQGPYEGALILSSHIHGDSATPDKSNPYYKQEVGAPNPAAVLQEIIDRQIELNKCRANDKIQESKNYQSLKKAENALNEFFDPTVIAIQNALPLTPQTVSMYEQKKYQHRAKSLIKQKELLGDKRLTTDVAPTQSSENKLKGPKGGREVI